MPVAAVVLSVLLAAALAGCGAEGPEARSPATAGVPRAAEPLAAVPSDGPARIVVENFVFGPSTLRVRAGQEIIVVNRDRATHTVTATDKKFDTGELGQADTATFRVDAPGEYAYICELHQYMKGTVTVS